MTQHSTDTSPPDGYSSPISDTPMERLGMIEGQLHDLGAKGVIAGMARDAQFRELQRLLSVEAEERRKTESTLADGLLTVGAAVGEARQETRALAKAVGRLSDEVVDTKVSLLAEAASIRREIRALHQQDSLTDIVLTEHTGAIEEHKGALARVGASITVVNGFKAIVVGTVTALASHPAEVLEFLGKALGRFF